MILSRLQKGSVSILAALGRRSYVPWNAGRAMGQKKAFSVAQARQLKKILKSKGSKRNLALISVAFDSCLRSCDLLSLEWPQVLNSIGEVRSRITIRQRKTGANVTFDLSPETRAVLIVLKPQSESGYIFSGKNPGAHLCGRQYRSLVKQWAAILDLDPSQYGTHSLRRTRSAAVYAKTKDPEIARILLGQKSLSATHRYLGIGQDDALARAQAVRL